ncbi:hypothetical protein GALMADRAFT_224164 [Galerina marginata CBS 339.88]|uniref:BZIP domain-containing protein n=1 Tax=Galerina marginata (strain CBS 339.88) TaxID=685588 RepID=A0A067TIY8_GALM3|nr:hypothetical protein GALMADRAFT_224164 [Galerina marginata CBS 339.88]
MSSKRGRKRNDNLPPNRARDVQRAFRARRAAHLQALEQRVSELEEENGCLRQALNLPPSNRPPLGKGPTGKDKVKIYNGGSAQSLGFYSSRESSSADSPPSRESSESPSALTVSMSSRPMTVIEPSSWSESMLLNDHHQQHTDISGPSDSPYHLAPMSAPLPLKPLQYPTYNNTFPSTSRPLSTNLYTGSQNNYSHSSDRPMAHSYDSQNFNIRGEIRDEPRQQYSYAQSFPSHDPNVHSHSTPPPTIPSNANTHHNNHNTQRESPLPYPHRRSLTDPQGFSIGQGFPHLPSPAQLVHHSRTPDYMRQTDNMHLTAPSRSGAYGSDGRLNQMP